MDMVLPGDCISRIISLTSPRDACRSSSVSSIFKAAEESDDVWESFLPHDYEDIILHSSSSPSSITSLTKKQIFFHLCDHPVILENGEMSVGLDKDSGKKMCRISAKRLIIVSGDTHPYWDSISLLESRFPKVSRLKSVWWLDIKGRVRASLLSPKTLYAAFFIFKLEDQHYFANRYVEMSVCKEKSGNWSHKRVILDPSTPSMEKRKMQAHLRYDGWMEVEMGEFFNEDGDGFIECRLWETNGYVKGGLLVEGLEFRSRQSICLNSNDK